VCVCVCVCGCECVWVCVCVCVCVYKHAHIRQFHLGRSCVHSIMHTNLQQQKKLVMGAFCRSYKLTTSTKTIYTYVYIHYTCIYITQTYIHQPTNQSVFLSIQLYMCACMHKNAFIHKHMRVLVCVCVCVRVYLFHRFLSTELASFDLL
jgi:hypothetical protein